MGEEMKEIKKRASKETIQGFYRLSTCNVSDAMDKLGLPCGIFGIKPMYNCPKVVGSAMTMHVVPYGANNPVGHMNVDPLASSQPGDVLVIDNSGRLDQNCWGEIVTHSAIQAGVAGVVIDGACRDVDAVMETNFPIYARGMVPLTARGRNVQGDYCCTIQMAGVQVNPGDVVMADMNGVVFIPVDRAEEVLKVSIELFEAETAMVNKIKAGQSFLRVDRESGYDKALKRN